MATRRLAVASALAVVGLAALAGTVFAAFRVAHMSSESGPVGAEVAIRVDASHLIGGSETSDLFLMTPRAYEDAPEPDRCGEIPGAVVVGQLQWHPDQVEFQGNTYDGYVAEGSFTVPEVPVGEYLLAGIVDDPYTGCLSFASFEVTTGMPDSATEPPQLPLTVIGLLLAAAAIGCARARVTAEG